MKSSNIGGQAVMEGIMMRHGDAYSIAVRKPDQEIEVKVEKYKSLIKNKKVLSLPIIRGVFSFIDSLLIGTKCLMYSASFFEDEEEEKKNITKEEREKQEMKQASQEKWLMYGTVAFSVVISVAVFMLLPYYLTSLLRHVTTSQGILGFAESLVRVLIFLLYLALISHMKDIQRTFEYHGAEHKCINCIEHGLELNVENVMKSSREHKRCGTSFLFFVMIVSAVFLMFIRVDSALWRVLIRILLLPVIAGVSYEIIRLAGRSDHKLVNLLSKPGMMIQHMTTREPDEEEVQVAITAVEAVFDWRAYLADNFDYSYGEAVSASGEVYE
ncbi:DUF1385 domain-containing protein [Novisyntrophococcus fermenticellae]|uniref:DUF1385 domain-containing protein n=1 Tax=Novisyntrophococcus fermenticellae TaxID=2068655 RepID=UPI001E2E0C74|nr:DUF1385 domain-containing protein [Novisyntrophococcus fermenticellae]